MSNVIYIVKMILEKDLIVGTQVLNRPSNRIEILVKTSILMKTKERLHSKDCLDSQ